MDPIIPEKEERVAHQEGLTARGRAGNGATEAALWPSDARGWMAKLAIPAVLLLVILIQYAVHSQGISALEAQVNALRDSAARPRSDPASAMIPAADHDSLDDLQALVSEHSGLIQTLEQRLATQIVELDNLRTTTSDNLALLGGAPLRGAGSLEELRETLANLDTRVTDLDTRAQPSAATDELDAQVAALRARLDEVASQTAANIAALEEQGRSLAQTSSQVASSLADAEDRTNNRIATLDESLTVNSTALTAEVQALTALVQATDRKFEELANQQHSLTEHLDSRLAALDNSLGDTTRPLASQLGELTNRFTSAEQRLNQLDEALSAAPVQTASPVDSATITGLTDGLETLRVEVDALANALSTLDSEQTTALRERDSRITQLDGRLDALAGDALDNLGADIARLDAAIAATGERLEDLASGQRSTQEQQDQRLAQLAERIDSVADNALTEARDSVQEFASRVADIDRRFAELEASLDGRIDRSLAGVSDNLRGLSEQTASLETTGSSLARDLSELRESLASESQRLASLESALENTNGSLETLASSAPRSTPVADADLTEQLISQRISAVLEPNLARLDHQADQIAALEARLTEQLADAATLQRDGDTLNDRLSQLDQRVATLDEGLTTALEQLPSTATKAELAIFIGAMESAMANLNRRIDAAGTMIAGHETRFAQWRDDVDMRPASVAASGDGAADVDELRRQLARQLEAIEELQAGNRRLVADLATTNQELANLRNNAGGAPAAVDDTRINALGRRVDDALASLNAQEVALNNWRESIENRIADNEGRLAAINQSSPVDQAEINRIRETIALLKKQHPFVRFP